MKVGRVYWQDPCLETAHTFNDIFLPFKSVLGFGQTHSIIEHMVDESNSAYSLCKWLPMEGAVGF